MVLLRAPLGVQQSSRSALSLSSRISSTRAGHYLGTINLRLGAVRRLAYEEADCGLLSADLAADTRRVKDVKKLGVCLGNGLIAETGTSALRSQREAIELRGLPRFAAAVETCASLAGGHAVSGVAAIQGSGTSWVEQHLNYFKCLTFRFLFAYPVT